MKVLELNSFKHSAYLNSGFEEVLALARPAFEELLFDLAAIPERASDLDKYRCFEACINQLNELESEVENGEHESFCQALCDISEIVDLDKELAYVNKWRA